MPSTKLHDAAWMTVLLASSPAFAQPPPEAAAPNTVELDTLEGHPSQYVGQRIQTSGEVQEVLGPHLFTIDEPHWIDFEGETLVYLPAPLAALVTPDAPVTVTGTVRPMVEAEIQSERHWFNDDPAIKAELVERPAIVAEGIVNTRDKTDLAIRIEPPPAAAGGTTIVDLNELAATEDGKLVGRLAELPTARVESVAKGGGFWVTSGDQRLFVMPSTPTRVTPGQTVAMRGVVLHLPEDLKESLGDKSMIQGERIYLYATRVTGTT